jgi:hypothetical protein
MREGMLVVVFDPTQDWQNRSSIPKVYAPNMNDYTWRGKWGMESIIFDMSQLTVVEQEAFVEDFCSKIMKVYAEPNYPRKPTFLIFEEAHTYFPEGCMRAKIHRNAVRMMTQGRNYDVRFACITQFASLIDKNAMRYMKQRYFGYTDEPNDTEYILKMFPKEFREQTQKYLTGLKAGQFIYKNGNAIDQFEIVPFHSETKPELVETHSNTSVSPISATKQYRNAGNDTIAIARLTFLTTIAFIFLWIIANAKR